MARKEIDPDADPGPVPSTGTPKPKGGRPKKGIEQEHIANRRAFAERLELQGASITQIAELTKVDRRTAQEDIKHNRRQRREAAAGVDLKEQRDLELDRLERQRAEINTVLAKPGVTPSQTAQLHNTLIRLSRRKSEITGMDMPRRIQLQEFSSSDEASSMMEEAPKERTLEDLVGDPAVAGELAKVLHLADRAAG